MNALTPAQLKAIHKAADACKEHGFSFINLYEAYPPAKNEGWDEYIYTPYDIDTTQYKYLGIVRSNGDYCLPFN